MALLIQGAFHLLERGLVPEGRAVSR
jgi:hypothetical protein